jgi:CO/xanthine dehydrogenase Mo-binding subunit
MRNHEGTLPKTNCSLHLFEQGLGELTAVSVAPASANAVYHATGKRMRDLPITIEKLL